MMESSLERVARGGRWELTVICVPFAANHLGDASHEWSKRKVVGKNSLEHIVRRSADVEQLGIQCRITRSQLGELKLTNHLPPS
jgi:hypothetical protein